VREAVSSGSAFVAPKRVREIVTRWAAESRPAPPAAPAPVSAADVRLPGGVSGRTTWAAVLSDLSRTFDAQAFERLLAGSLVVRYWRGSVEVQVGSLSAAEKLGREYRGLIERQLNARLSRPVAIQFVPPPADERLSVTDEPPAPPNPPDRFTITRADLEIGRQVWQSLLIELARSTPPADIDSLAGVAMLGQDPSGEILLAAPSPRAGRLLDGRYRAAVEIALASLFGRPLPFRVAASHEWAIAEPA
jgi:hypothetical protein